MSPWVKDAERWRTLSTSPLLPLPVELVAGGEGRPERESVDDAPGLGGSGKSGTFSGKPAPMKIAEDGRRVLEIEGLGRAVIAFV